MQRNINPAITEKNVYGKKFWLMMCVFYALFIIRIVLRIHFPVVLYLAWVLVMALAFDDNEIKALVISFIPLSSGFQYKYAMFICIVALIVKYYKRLRVNSIILIGSALMVWELLHFGIGTPSLIELARGFAELLFLMIVLCLPSKRRICVSEVTRLLAISSTVAFVILLFATVAGRGQSILDLMQNGFRFGISEDTGGSFVFRFNSNALGTICNLAIAGLLINIYNKSAKLVDYFMIVFMVFIGLLTVSRTFLLCLGIMVVLFVLLQRKSLMRRVLTVFALATVGTLMLIVIINYFPSIIDNYNNRLNVEDISNGRSFLFGYYNDVIFSSARNIFFGIGIQQIATKSYGITGIMADVPHNGVQQVVVAWGIPGLVLMILFIYKLVKQGNTNKKSPLLYYLPLLISLITSLPGQFVTVPAKMLSLLFIFEIFNNSKIDVGGKKNAE